MKFGSSRGFSLVEALVAVILLSTGVVATLMALGSTARTEAYAREKERMQRLAVMKYEELLVTGDAMNAMANGDFQDYREDRYLWEAEVAPTGIENLQSLTVTVTRRSSREAPEASVTGLTFTPPDTGVGVEAP